MKESQIKWAKMIILAAVFTTIGTQFGTKLFTSAETRINKPESNEEMISENRTLIRVNNVNSINRDKEVSRYADSLHNVHGSCMNTLDGKIEFLIDFLQGMKQTTENKRDPMSKQNNLTLKE